MLFYGGHEAPCIREDRKCPSFLAIRKRNLESPGAGGTF
jgi:hypothetical protein